MQQPAKAKVTSGGTSGTFAAPLRHGEESFWSHGIKTRYPSSKCPYKRAEESQAVSFFANEMFMNLAEKITTTSSRVQKKYLSFIILGCSGFKTFLFCLLELPPSPGCWLSWAGDGRSVASDMCCRSWVPKVMCPKEEMFKFLLCGEDARRAHHAAGGPNISPVIWDAIMLPFPK